MKVNQLSPRISVAISVVVLVAGCSGGSGPSSGGPTTGPATGASATASQAMASDEPGAGGGGGGPTGQSVTDLAQLSNLLGPGDFSAAGVAGAGTPTVNNPESGAVYVVYAGKSGGTGGIEFDAVVGESAVGMGDVFASMAAPFLDFEAKGKADLPMADDAQLRTDNPLDNGGTWAGVAVQKGRLVFLIAIPGSPDAEGQLVTLAKLVLERGSGLE